MQAPDLASSRGLGRHLLAAATIAASASAGAVLLIAVSSTVDAMPPDVATGLLAFGAAHPVAPVVR